MSSAAAAPSRSLLDPGSELVDPPQCSLWFEPKEWSRRYDCTFWTCDVVLDEVAGPSGSDQATAPAPTPDGAVTIRARAGGNEWRITKTSEQFEQMAKQLSFELAAHKHDFVAPALPAKKWSLTGAQDTSPEAVEQRRAAYSAWLRSVLGGSRKMCLFPAVRSFLQLDRQLAQPEEEEQEDDGEEAAAAAAEGAGGNGQA